jgi:DNA-binding CsgD family transcriptional regulator
VEGGIREESSAPAGAEERSPLLERDAEKGAIRAVLEDAKEGKGGVAFIQSAPGLGKSRLLEAAREAAGESGLAVLAAVASELESQFAFGVVLQLFERHVRRAPAAERRRLLRGAAALTAPLWEGTGAGTEEIDAFSLLHGLHWIAANAAEERPLAVLVDDAHWADPASLRWLVYLANRIDGLAVALLVAARERADAEADGLLRELASSPAVEVLRPRPLSRGGSRELLEFFGFVEPEAGFVDAGFEATGGNPLLVRELARALRAEGVAPDRLGAARAREIGPEPVSRATELALARLPGSASALARAIAVLGDGEGVAIAAELAGLTEKQGTAIASELVREGVLARGPGLRFAHPIVRAALYEEMPPPERAAAHWSAGRLLRDRGAHPERVAAHLLHAEPHGEDWAAEALALAASEASDHGARDAAASYLRRAIEEGGGDRRALFADLARAQAAAGDPAAEASYEEAIALSSDPREGADILRELGRALYLQSRFDEAVDAFSRGLEVLGDGDERLRMYLAAGKSAAMVWSGAGGDAFGEIDPLLERARGGTDVAERAVLANLAGAQMLRGADRAKTIELAELAWGDGAILAEGTSRSEPSVLAITGALTVAERYDLVLSICRTMIDHARRRGQILAFSTFSFVRSYTHLMLGNVGDAIADAEQALAGRSAGWRLFLEGAVWVAVRGHTERGDPEAAAAVCQAGSAAERAGPASALLPLARGELALARRDATSALVEIQSAQEALDAWLGRGAPGWFERSSALVRALAAAKRHEEAVAAAAENLERAQRWGSPRNVAEALRVRGLAEGGVESIPWFERAVGAAEASEGRLTRAHALVSLGVALRVAGRRTEAKETLLQALDAAGECGALGLLKTAREELVIAGGRPRRERAWGVEALTPSERRVAEMAASGMTNRAIAQALFVTVKAVEYHLRNAYRKLGIAGRDGLPEALVDRPPGG